MCKDKEYLSKKIDWEGNLLKNRKKLLSNIKKLNSSVNMLDTDILEVYSIDLNKFLFLLRDY